MYYVHVVICCRQKPNKEDNYMRQMQKNIPGAVLSSSFVIASIFNVYASVGLLWKLIY